MTPAILNEKCINSMKTPLEKCIMQYKKFVYSMLEKKGRSENYQAAIQWLQDAGIINLCYNLSNISYIKKQRAIWREALYQMWRKQYRI